MSGVEDSTGARARSTTPLSISSKTSEEDSTLCAFHPDHDSQDEDMAGVPSDDDDEDALFAFQRPNTAIATVSSDTPNDVSRHEGDDRKDSLVTSTIDHDSEEPAAWKLSPTFAVHTDLDLDDSESLKCPSQSTTVAELPPAATRGPVEELPFKNGHPLPSVSYRHSMNERGVYGHKNQNRTAYIRKDRGTHNDRTTALPGALRDSIIRRRRDNRCPEEHMRSTHPEETGNLYQLETIRGLSAIHVRRNNSVASWNFSELRGPTTLPAGATTRDEAEYGDTQDAQPLRDDDDYLVQEEDSPYAEVRSSISNIDDTSMPAVTIRSMTIGTIMCAGITGLNTYARFRDPGIWVQPVVVQMVSYPLGKFCAWALPWYAFKLPQWLGGIEIDLNPGPFNIKEHSAIMVMVYASSPSMLALFLSVAADKYIGHPLSERFPLLLTLACRIGGTGIACFLLKLLVWPASMIYPYITALGANLNAFHAEDERDGSVPRIKLLVGTFLVASIYYFVPGYIMTSLSYFSWVCWIAPANIVLNQLFGVVSGLGMSLVTFDWYQVVSAGNPAVIPWWTMANMAVGFFLCYWFITPTLYYTNTWSSAYLPLLSRDSFDRYGRSYDVGRVLLPDQTLNVEAYRNYSPMYLSVTYILTYISQLGLLTSSLVHTALNYGQQIWKTLRHGSAEAPDIHFKLMSQYKEVPKRWGFLIFLLSIVVIIVNVKTEPTHFPIWAVFLTLVVPLIWVVPSGLLVATSGVSLSTSSIVQLLPGYLMKGSILHNITFRVIAGGYMDGTVQSLSCFKLGHYMKIPPRTNLALQVLSVTIATLSGYGCKWIMTSKVPDLCQHNQKDHLTCSSIKMLVTNGVFWGSIGPARVFDGNSPYWGAWFGLLAGALLPVMTWWLGRRFPETIVKDINLMLVFTGSTMLPGVPAVGFVNLTLSCFVIQFWLRRYHFWVWSKYAYVFNIALEFGTALSMLFIMVTLTQNGVTLDWIGNTIYKHTADWHGLALKSAPENGFGRTSGWQ